jgi:hypothetical protein
MKRYITLIAAVALVACSNEELSTPDNALVSKEAPVNFEVYTQRGVTRAGTPGDIDNNNIGDIGFSVFAYYTAGDQYSQKATPNFMYNEHVTKVGDDWKYEPVKFWPNEYGSNAKSEEVDRLSFFAYAPWTDVDPTTGNVVGTTEKEQSYNIVSVNKHGATGDPIVKYVVDTDPATSVDLLWGVAAANPGNYYKPIQGTVDITAGKPFIDLVKPNDPANDKLSFNLKHALAKVKVTIDYIDDAETPDGTSQTINPDETRIYVRNFKMTGFALKGALNLNNTDADKPLWKDFDGAKDLAFDEIVFQDGRKDGKEGETNGAQTNETPQGLNEDIIENYSAPATPNTFGSQKTSGVTATPKLLFGGTYDPTSTNAAKEGYFYVIPRNGGSGVDIEIAYDVETIDRKLVGKISDNETHGISIENVISKEKIFGDGVDFEPGKVYEIKIHIGMTSMKVDAEVLPWDAVNSQNVDLPANQDGTGTGGNGGNNQNQTATQQAIAYQYADYTYNGQFAYVDDNNLTYTVSAANAQNPTNVMNDLARYLGALYRGGNVQQLTYGGKTYTWDPTTAGNLKGSNWVNAEGNTLVSVITAEVNATGALPQSITIGVDGTDVTTTITVQP